MNTSALFILGGILFFLALIAILLFIAQKIREIRCEHHSSSVWFRPVENPDWFHRGMWWQCSRCKKIEPMK